MIDICKHRTIAIPIGILNTNSRTETLSSLLCSQLSSLLCLQQRMQWANVEMSQQQQQQQHLHSYVHITWQVSCEPFHFKQISMGLGGGRFFVWPIGKANYKKSTVCFVSLTWNTQAATKTPTQLRKHCLTSESLHFKQKFRFGGFFSSDLLSVGNNKL